MAFHVYIHTWCRDVRLLPGITLIFKSLRVGFPTAKVVVVDAGSVADAASQIRAATESCGGRFIALERFVELFNFMKQALHRQKEGTAIFVDPDVCFWDNVESWHFDGLAAGRFIPMHHCQFTGCLTHPRLHTSFFWIPDVFRFQREIAACRSQFFRFDPFRSMMFRGEDGWEFFDVAASLYGAFPADMQAFTEDQLNCYDHAFAGSYSDSVESRLSPRFQTVFKNIHEVIRSDYTRLRGAWRIQQKYFDEQMAGSATPPECDQPSDD